MLRMRNQTKKKRIKWLLDALRSGKYNQGTGRLLTISDAGNGRRFYCCLGVACEVYNDHHKKNKLSFEILPSDVIGVGSFNGEKTYLPREVAKWFGFNRENPGLWKGALTVLNDNGYTFAMIADRIERNPSKYCGEYRDSH